MTDTTRNLLISLSAHMAYMQGQLEARHELDDPEDFYWYRESVLLRQKVTDALADEPAVPEGREPAAVTGQPSDEEGPSVEEVEGLCEEHCFNVEGYESIECLQGLINEAIARWGNLKGSLTSSPPADGEVAECAVELLQRQARVPVSVSERLQQMEDLAADAVAGLRYIEESHGRLYGVGWDRVYDKADRLKPAHALPLPEVGK